MPSTRKPTPRSKPGDHKLLACLTPAEERRLKQAYPQTAKKGPVKKAR